MGSSIPCRSVQHPEKWAETRYNGSGSMAKPDSSALAVRSGPRTGPRPKMTGDEMLLISRLHRSGRKIAEIARLLTTPERTLSAETVGQWLRRAKQPQEDLHIALASLRSDAVESWGLAMRRGARDGRHAPAKDLLTATGTIRADATDRLVIVIGSGAASEPATLTPLPHRTPDILIAALPPPQSS